MLGKNKKYYSKWCGRITSNSKSKLFIIEWQKGGIYKYVGIYRCNIIPFGTLIDGSDKNTETLAVVRFR